MYIDTDSISVNNYTSLFSPNALLISLLEQCTADLLTVHYCKLWNKRRGFLTYQYIVWEHWSDTREFITRSADLLNRGMRVLLQQSIYHVSIVYTCNTYFVMHWSIWFIPWFQVNTRIQY